MRTPLLMLAVALSLASCAGTGPNVFNRPASLPVAVPCLPALDSLAGLPAYLVPAPAGSTPRQKRQWQKAQAANLARAGVLPAKLKNSSLAQGPGAVATTVTKPSGAVNTANHGTAVNAPKAGQRGGAAGIGPNAHAEVTAENGLSYWWLLVPVVGVVWWQRKRLAVLLL